MALDVTPMKTFTLAPLFFGGPTCTRCGTRMWLTRIFPDSFGDDTRIFECPHCEHEVIENPDYKRAD